MTHLWEAVLSILGDVPLADFPEIELRAATDTAPLPDESLIFNFSLAPLRDEIAENQTVRVSTTFELRLSADARTRAEVQSAIAETVSALRALTVSAFADYRDALDDDEECPIFYSAFRLLRVGEVTAEDFSFVIQFEGAFDAQL